MAAHGTAAGTDGAHELASLRERLRAATLRPEADASEEARADLEQAPLGALGRAGRRAARWVEVARADKRSRPLIERMLEQFPLDSVQGKALMGLAEALLRTPDPKRADQLIAERLATMRSAGLPGDTDLLLRTGFTLLGAAGRLLPDVVTELSGEFSAASLTRPVVAPVVRAALRQSMQLLGDAFIVGETIDAALERGAREPDLQLCSFDMLGEAARTDADAERYFEAYADAIGRSPGRRPRTSPGAPGISVKLSALHPRYELRSARASRASCGRACWTLARRRRRFGIGFTIDAEEADRLELSLESWRRLCARSRPRRLGRARRSRCRPIRSAALPVLDWLADAGAARRRRLMVRLVKGAYWDSEIKRAQERGLAGYPGVHPQGRDRRLLPRLRRAAAGRARASLSAIRHPQRPHRRRGARARRRGARDLEFQRLHGMGEALYARACVESPQLPPCRVYAPVGSARGPAALSRAPAARERRQHLVRQPFWTTRTSGGGDGAPIPVDARSMAQATHPRIALPRDALWRRARAIRRAGPRRPGGAARSSKPSCGGHAAEQYRGGRSLPGARPEMSTCRIDLDPADPPRSSSG